MTAVSGAGGGAADAVATGGGASTSVSMQLATLDADGVFKTWTVVEDASADSSGSLRELGLLPGGRVRVMPGATVSLFSSPNDARDMSLLMQASCLALLPDRPNQVKLWPWSILVHHGLTLRDLLSVIHNDSISLALHVCA